MTSSGGELALQTAVRKVAKERGWREFRSPKGKGNVPQGSSKGWLDLFLIRRGQIVVIEFKPATGRELTAEQEEWLKEWCLAEVQNAGVYVAVVRPDDYDDIVKRLA